MAGGSELLHMPIGDLATWVGAIASAGAATAAAYAARVAVRLARLPVEQQEGFKRAEARTIAAGIRSELERAQYTLARMLTQLDALESPQEQVDRLRSLLETWVPSEYPMIERFMASFGSFGEDDAGALMSATADIFNYGPIIATCFKTLDGPLFPAQLRRNMAQMVYDDARTTTESTLLHVRAALKIVEERCRIQRIAVPGIASPDQ